MTITKEKSQRQMILEMSSKYLFQDKHALFVENVSLMIFDTLADRDLFNASDRLLLSHASLLHDVGNCISEKKHHRHTKYIIDHDEALADYPEKARKLVSLIAYNHRKKLCDEMDVLSKKEQETVLQLSAILRVADALDYTREEVMITGITRTDTEVLISISGVLPERLESRLNRKKELFLRIFHLDVVLKG